MDDRCHITALFPHDVILAPLVQSLRDAGLSDEQVAIMTPLPLSDAASARIGLLPLYVVTLLAGLVGIGVGLFFAGGTAVMYPLMTGGKPIVAAPVVGIISYETMMLLAIVATFVTMIVGIKRAQRGVAQHDTRIDDGYIVISITCNPDASQVAMARALLQGAGALEVSPPHPFSEQAEAQPGGEVAAALLAMLCILSGVTACSRDMQEQPSYQPQESPRLHSPVGSVPRSSRKVLPARPVSGQEADNRGASLFRINCLHCHGAQGDGDGPVAPFLKEPPANLKNNEVRAMSLQDIYGVLTHGKDMMPSFAGELSAEERWQLARFVSTLSGPNTAHAEPAEPR